MIKQIVVGGAVLLFCWYCNVNGYLPIPIIAGIEALAGFWLFPKDDRTIRYQIIPAVLVLIGLVTIAIHIAGFWQ